MVSIGIASSTLCKERKGSTATIELSPQQNVALLYSLWITPIATEFIVNTSQRVSEHHRLITKHMCNTWLYCFPQWPLDGLQHDQALSRFVKGLAGKINEIISKGHEYFLLLTLLHCVPFSRECGSLLPTDSKNCSRCGHPDWFPPKPGVHSRETGWLVIVQLWQEWAVASFPGPPRGRG